MHSCRQASRLRGCSLCLVPHHSTPAVGWPTRTGAPPPPFKVQGLHCDTYLLQHLLTAPDRDPQASPYQHSPTAAAAAGTNTLSAPSSIGSDSAAAAAKLATQHPCSSVSRPVCCSMRPHDWKYSSSRTLTAKLPATHAALPAHVCNSVNRCGSGTVTNCERKDRFSRHKSSRAGAQQMLHIKRPMHTLALLWGSTALPHFLPTMSANPSPAAASNNHHNAFVSEG